jgi:hypothetical protein
LSSPRHLSNSTINVVFSPLPLSLHSISPMR